MTRVWSFYDPATGVLTGRRLSCSERVLAANTPDGLAAIEGRYDHLSQRVDLETGAVVLYDNPLREQRAQEARARQMQGLIDDLERQQLRAMRELLLGDESARDRLKATDDEITSLRASLQSGVSTQQRAGGPGDL